MGGRFLVEVSKAWMLSGRFKDPPPTLGLERREQAREPLETVLKAVNRSFVYRGQLSSPGQADLLGFSLLSSSLSLQTWWSGKRSVYT